MNSPLKRLLLVSDGTHLTGLYMQGQQYELHPTDSWVRDDDLPLLIQTKQQLADYFGGTLQKFDVPLKLSGSKFQKQVWSMLSDIPYGTTTTYGTIANHLGDPEGARDVGLAIGMNPISVIIPCHRVVSSMGKLTGYNGGLERKRLLLDLESGKQSLALNFT